MFSAIFFLLVFCIGMIAYPAHLAKKEKERELWLARKEEERRYRIKQEEEKVSSNIGAYWVKVAESGNGKVFHAENCGRCRSTKLIPIQNAREQGYLPCSTCGGEGTYYDYKED